MSNSLVVVASTIKRKNSVTGIEEQISTVLIPTKNPQVFAVKLQEQGAFRVGADGWVEGNKSALLKFNIQQNPALANLTVGIVFPDMRIRTQYSIGKPFYQGQEPMRAGKGGNRIQSGGVDVFMLRTPSTDLTAADDAKPVYDKPAAAPAAVTAAAPAATPAMVIGA